MQMTKLKSQIGSKKLDSPYFLRAPPGRLGSSFMRFPAMSLLFNALKAASAALTS